MPPGMNSPSHRTRQKLCEKPERVEVITNPTGGTQPALLDQVVLLDEVIDQPQRGGQRQRPKAIVLLRVRRETA
jgi:hypothetical protein